MLASRTFHTTGRGEARPRALRGAGAEPERLARNKGVEGMSGPARIQEQNRTEVIHVLQYCTAVLTYNLCVRLLVQTRYLGTL